MTGLEVANIASGLTSMARERPDALAVLAPAGRDSAGRAKHVHWTFRQLDRESDFVAAGLLEQGIGRGARAVLMVRPSLSFFSMVFGLFKAGVVPVMVDPGLGVRNLGPCLAEARPEAFIGIPRAQMARRLLGWGRATIRKSITIGPAWPAGWLDSFEMDGLAENDPPTLAPVGAEETAAILFTSGSTGVPKGVVYTHAIFRAQVAMLRELYDIRPGEVDLCTFPLFALFSPILGMTSVVPEMNFTRPGKVDPRKVIEAIEDFGVTNLFGSPALIRRVGDYGAWKKIKLPSLRRVISAGAPVPARVLETFAKRLGPGAQVFTPYGATESLPVCSIGSDEVLGETRHATNHGAGVCVGRPVDRMRVEIIAIRDEAIPTWSDDLLVPDGEVGEIAVQGPVVTRSYFQRPEATTLAKIDDPATRGFFHRMGDLGYRDDRGRIWFCGRKSHRVRTAAGTLYTIPCEGVFNVHPFVHRTALVGVGEPGLARPVLCVERVSLTFRLDEGRIREELLTLGAANPITREIRTILFHPSFPVDIRHNAKIFREKLAKWAEGQLS
jgi:acyl-CoA synthetase (AMP-forming)/AMP-acid ligase II